jgi:hypothetical protein
MKNKIIIGIMGVLLCWGGLSQAAPITIQITGNVTSARGSALPSTIHVGDTFTGIYTYDSTTTNSSSGIFGRYVQNSPYGITLALGGLEFETSQPHVGQFVINIAMPSSQNWYSYSINSYLNAPLSNELTVSSIGWRLGDSTYTALSSTALPLTAPLLSQWQSNILEIWGGSNSFYINGVVMQAVLIPEPVTGALMAVGVLFLRRKR